MYTNIQISILLHCYAGDPSVSKFVGGILWTIMSHDETLRNGQEFLWNSLPNFEINMQHFKKSVAIELLTRKEENCVSEFRNNIR
jgi:hypothetical protein